ncbi:anaerobic ribonucleoside-triphosphate reductase [Rothia sp. 32237D007AR]
MLLIDMSLAPAEASPTQHPKHQRPAVAPSALTALQEGAPEALHENANKDATVFNTQRDLTAGAVAKDFALEHLLPAQVAEAHRKGDIHFHDLDYSPYTPMTNCCLIDIEGMLAGGFTIGNAQVESPKSIQTATAQISQIIANVASSQYGGCSVDRTDQVLAPYAALNYEKHLADARRWVAPDLHADYASAKTIKDIYDAMQSLEYEVNTLYSSNGQTPFVTLGFGLGTGRWEREIQQAILKVRLAGIGSEGRTAIFPKLVFGLRRGVNLEPSDPNYDIKQLALECSTRRMYPDVINYEKLVEITGSYKVPMGCRSFLQDWQNPTAEDQESSTSPAGRMNLGVVTLNLPRIALETYQQGQDAFWQLFEQRLELAHQALAYRVARCYEALPENAPILYQHGAFGLRAERGQSVAPFFDSGRATVSLGYIGLYEVAALFYGGQWENQPEAKSFTLDIVRRLKEACTSWNQSQGPWYSVYSTPSESLTDRFARLDAQRFGLIDDVTDKGYYTNSFHYDVRKKISPFAKLDFEKDYPLYASGGFIHYCEYPKLSHNLQALEAVWDYAYERVGYLGTNTPIDRCYECNFEGDFDPTAQGFTCPQCGNTNPETCDVVKRTCGYLGNPVKRPMVRGRHEEIISRVKHMSTPSAS